MAVGQFLDHCVGRVFRSHVDQSAIAGASEAVFSMAASAIQRVDLATVRGQDIL